MSERETNTKRQKETERHKHKETKRDRETNTKRQKGRELLTSSEPSFLSKYLNLF